jgi:hypothetical protein
MVRKLGMLMGSLFLIGGILAFVPGVTKNDMYFGVFMVNTPHNIMHIAHGMKWEETADRERTTGAATQ